MSLVNVSETATSVFHLSPVVVDGSALPIENPELAFMADVLNPERTESAHLNTESQTPTLEAPADHFDSSEELTTQPASGDPQRAAPRRRSQPVAPVHPKKLK